MTRDECLLMIFGLKTTYVGEVCSGLMSVQNIWSVLTSVEDVDVPAKVPGGLQPCGYIGGW